MKYSQGSYGRVFLIKFDDKDNLLESLKNIARKEQVRAGTIMLLGGMRTAGIVTGPKEAVVPPEPMWLQVNDGREVLGIGTLFWKDDDPVIHLHGAMGREQETFTGCIRKDSSVYLIVEAVITEIKGIDARRVLDEKSGVVMLEL